jgi:hypothetical protein
MSLPSLSYRSAHILNNCSINNYNKTLENYDLKLSEYSNQATGCTARELGFSARQAQKFTNMANITCYLKNYHFKN